jgi:hypothetical protein
MKLMSWAMAFLGLWILLAGIMGSNMIVSVICGLVIVVLSVMAALKKG